MSAHDFLFALDLSNDPQFGGMLSELTAAVCTHVGLGDAAKELTASLRDALSAGAAKGQTRCDIGFTAANGQLQIVVRFAGGGDWRASRALPAGQA